MTDVLSRTCIWWSQPAANWVLYHVLLGPKISILDLLRVTFFAGTFPYAFWTTFLLFCLPITLSSAIFLSKMLHRCICKIRSRWTWKWRSCRVNVGPALFPLFCMLQASASLPNHRDGSDKCSCWPPFCSSIPVISWNLDKTHRGYYWREAEFMAE